MKKITKKKTLTAVTGATVIGVAAAALVNGSKLDSVFNPGKFEKFENMWLVMEKKQTLPVIM